MEKIPVNSPFLCGVYFLRHRPYMNSKANEAQNNETAVSLGQQLRAVGQGLESLDVEDFDLQAEGAGYFALGMAHAQAKTADAASSPQSGLKDKLQNAWYSLTSRVDNADQAAKAPSNVLRILFTPEGILRLECEGISKRSDDSVGIPNLKKLAQILRMVGEYLDTKSGRLLKASKRQDRISFEYETASGQPIKEEWKLSQLYDSWVKVSSQREQRYDMVERELGSEQEIPGSGSHR
jgi:hypothetical protein